MNARRSPPMVSAGSQPDLSKLRDESIGVTFRKRKHTECNCDHSEALLEFQNKIMQTITSTLETQNQNIITTLEILRQDVIGFRHDLETVNGKIVGLSEEQRCIKKDVSDLKSTNTVNISRIQTVSHDLVALQATVTSLSDQLRVKEQQGRINNLEIAGIPVTKGENIVSIVHNIAKTINFPITMTDIDYIHRVRRFKQISLD